jgi:hypothetical protein
MEISTFTCTICGDGSREICLACTKDTCPNHLCDRCHRCSDCCTCEFPLSKSGGREPTQPDVAPPHAEYNGANGSESQPNSYQQEEVETSSSD